MQWLTTPAESSIKVRSVNLYFVLHHHGVYSRIAPATATSQNRTYKISMLGWPSMLISAVHTHTQFASTPQAHTSSRSHNSHKANNEFIEKKKQKQIKLNEVQEPNRWLFFFFYLPIPIHNNLIWIEELPIWWSLMGNRATVHINAPRKTLFLLSTQNTNDDD